MLSVSGSGEMFPIKNTFIHFSDVAAGARRRCLSSPAEVFAELVWQANAKLEQVRAKKRAARKVRRWAQLVRGAWQALGQKHLDDARKLQRFRYEKVTPKYRLTMPHRIFQYFTARVFAGAPRP